MKSKWKLTFGPLNEYSCVVEAVAYGQTVFEALGQLDKLFCEVIDDESSVALMMGPEDFKALFDVCDHELTELNIWQMGEEESAFKLTFEYGDFDVAPSADLTA